jgi:hypothetical protein
MLNKPYHRLNLVAQESKSKAVGYLLQRTDFLYGGRGMAPKARAVYHKIMGRLYIKIT